MVGHSRAYYSAKIVNELADPAVLILISPFFEGCVHS